MTALPFRLLVAAMLVVAACPGDDEGRARSPKIKRWATEVLPPPAPPEVPDVSEEESRPAVPAEDATSTARPRDACEVLIEMACSALGPHTEECHEAQRVLPRERTPEWRDGCQHVIDEHVTEPAPEWAGRRRNACRRLERRICKDVGAETWQCRQARADASRLRWERPQACLGDLLSWEAKRLFSEPGVSPTGPAKQAR